MSLHFFEFWTCGSSMLILAKPETGPVLCMVRHLDRIFEQTVPRESLDRFRGQLLVEGWTRD